MNRNSLVFNRTNASILIGILPHQVKKVEEWTNCVYVYGNKDSKKISKFVSKKKFLEAFVNSRKERSKLLTVQKISPTEYAVYNPENDHNYLVELSGKVIECGCEDYKNQMAVFGKAACKHIYATLTYMGYSSLKAYETNH